MHANQLGDSSLQGHAGQSDQLAQSEQSLRADSGSAALGGDAHVSSDLVNVDSGVGSSVDSSAGAPAALVVGTAATGSTQGRFSLETALKLGWENCWRYIFAYIGICTATFLLASIPTLFSMIVAYVNSNPTLLSLGVLASIFGLVLQQWVAMGMLNLQLRILDGKKIETRDVFTGYGGENELIDKRPVALQRFYRILKFAAAALMVQIVTMLGYLCFIVPGVIAHIKFQFFGYFIIERNMGPLQAMRASALITNGIKMDLFLFGIVQWFINMAGGMCFMIGGFPAWIINSIATASVYRQLIENTPQEQLLAITDKSHGLPTAEIPAA